MRFINLCLIALLANNSLAAQSKPVLAGSIQILSTELHVGDAPLALFKITNKSKQTVFIDLAEVHTQSAIDYPGQDPVIEGIPGLTMHLATCGVVLKRDFQRNNLAGLEAGQSLVRVVQIREISNPGSATLWVSVEFPCSFLGALQEVNWPGCSVSAEKRIKILPAKAKPSNP